MSKWIKPGRWKVAIGVTLMLWAVLFIILRIGTESNNPLAASNINQKPANLGIQLKSEMWKTNTLNEDDASKNNKNPRTATEIAVVKEWLGKAGYDPEKRIGYRAYSDQILSDLVKNGDTIAMYVMEERAIDAGDISKAKTYAELGIAYGSLRSINSMAIYTEPSFSGFPIETAKAQLKENLAYLELLSIRGDSQSATLKKNINLKLFEQGYGQENLLNSEDEKWIHARALELYNHYRAERIKLGLGDFDNSTPKEVTDLFGK